MPRTLVAFHAHPDDEVVLTAGTMAKAAAQGHRVVLVLATDGGLGATAYVDEERLGRRRLAEARASARILGVARFAHLGYADSGPGGDPGERAVRRTPFVTVPVAEAAQRLAEILREEQADVLLSYDRHGGYGHPDHVRVHQVGALAARWAGTPRVLEATAPIFAARAEITHRVAVIGYAGLKRAALRAHASQTAAADGADRALARLARIPRPLYDLVFGWEWYVDPAYRGPLGRDVFAGLP